MKWFDRIVRGNTGTKKNQENEERYIEVLDVVGWGSYGIIHNAKFVNGDGNDDNDDSSILVAKRAWTLDELKEKPPATTATTKDDGDIADIESTASQIDDEKENKMLKGRAERCRYYLDVEQHCGTKISSSKSGGRRRKKDRTVLPPRLFGKYKDNSTDNPQEWLVFERITRSSRSMTVKEEKKVDAEKQIVPLVARSLKNVMDLDWIDQHRIDDGLENQHHHLYMIQKELQLPEESTFDDTLDSILKCLLDAIVVIHDFNIAHRDIKPDNILIDGQNEQFVIIDFGSAQDVDVQQRMMFVFDGETTVALSPIYAAPEGENFEEWDK